jgi:hypothetical protein
VNPAAVADGIFASSRTMRSEIVLRVAIAACSSLTKSSVAIVRLVMRNVSTSLIVCDCCAAVGRANAADRQTAIAIVRVVRCGCRR